MKGQNRGGYRKPLPTIPTRSFNPADRRPNPDPFGSSRQGGNVGIFAPRCFGPSRDSGRWVFGLGLLLSGAAQAERPGREPSRPCPRTGLGIRPGRGTWARLECRGRRDALAGRLGPDGPAGSGVSSHCATMLAWAWGRPRPSPPSSWSKYSPRALALPWSRNT